MMLHNKYQGSMLYGFREDFFSCFPYVNPGVGPFLTPGAYLNKLDRGPLGDVKYQVSRLLALWFQTRRFFHIFPI